MSDSISISAATRVRRILLRLWIELLTLAEFAVCCFIYERTYPFKGKTETAISVDQFLHGVNGRNGFRQGGVPMGRTKLMEVLKSLEAKGAIFRHGVSGRWTIYGLNPHWHEEWALRDASYPQRPVDNLVVPNGSRPQARTRGVRTSEHRTSETNFRKEPSIVVGTRPAAAVPPQQQQKGKVSHSRKASHGRGLSSRGAS